MRQLLMVPGDRLYLGLDLGRPSEPSSLAIVERTWVDNQSHYKVRHLQRWPAGTPYPTIRDDLMVKLKALDECTLGIDQTAVGKGVIDIFMPVVLSQDFHPVIITAGRTPSFNQGIQFVPKIDLAATLQKLLQTNRIHFAKLPETPTLVKELLEFRTNIPSSAADDIASWRERPHDDLCFAVMIAVWLAERQDWGYMLAPFAIAPGIDFQNPFA
jgi:hypothetical protein